MKKETKKERETRWAAKRLATVVKEEEFKRDLPRKILFEFIPELLKRGIDFSFIPNSEESDGKISINFDNEWHNIVNLEEWSYQCNFIDFITKFDQDQKKQREQVMLREITLKSLTQAQKDAIKGFI